MTARNKTASAFVVLLIAMAIGLISAGSAAAQDSTPPPSPGLSDALKQNPNEGNDFQQARRECEEANAVDDVLEALPLPGVIDSALDVAGAIGLDGVLNEVGCLEAAYLTNPIDAYAAAIETTASKLWGDPVGDFAKAVMEGNTEAFRAVMTFWMSSGIPGLAADNAMSGLRNIISGFTVVALFVSIVIAMTKLAIARKQAVMEGATETANMLVRTVITVSLLPMLVLMFHQAGDVASAYALEEFVGGDMNDKITAITALDETTGLGPIFALACAGIAFLGSVAQLIALLIREAVLCVVVAVIPLAAASSAMGTGRSSYKSMIAFTLGALLFKPAATLLYLFAFWAASSPADQIETVIIGSILLAVVGFSLPTMIKIIAPAAETISAGGREVAALASAAGSLAAGGAMGAARAAGGASKVMSGSASNGGAGASGAAGTGARPTAGLQGQYTGGTNSGGAPSGGGSASGGGSPGPSGARRAGSGVAKTASAGLAGAAGALKVAGAGARAVGSITGQLGSAAEGAVGNYHGRIQR